ncbi:4Fe-4S ferredoxin, iron-sulpur binding domain-containing protein [Alkalidesulfovibrio alkalitolerans DSM 16529]|uniref:4Fe-4S ferredoxin, iron-sulpur binding domain-containing protein n=1 Tax=Alkalidesulfovibrio alkalitolerans DSM 16529 TaxID=1121439 RepID=S7TDY0_9BACT|nr:4Fe-4S binding protein [Alkalidesulfovibrio alkalitolerans]EPR34755.1 4Fe-4S ferredoxin, iron-sulpur binding domain-containing protein [Alkalidesulfovibrio alkalitolerans DSM 16529]
MTLRGAVQAVSLAAFVLLVLGAAEALLGQPGRDLFVRLDPAAALVTLLADRSLTVKIAPGLVVLATGLVLGRAFCGFVCPLGATIDATDRLLRHFRTSPPRLPAWPKFAVLAAMLAAAAFGVSLAFAAAPLPLAARLYGLAVQPPLALAADLGLHLFAPLAREAGMLGLAYAEIPVPAYDTLVFVLVFFTLVIGAGAFVRRAWCRMLCPAGAGLGLLALASPFRRRVSSACTACGRCARVCPSGAIQPGPRQDFAATRHVECFACLRCRDACPERAISFMPRAGRNAATTAPTGSPGFSPLRRAIIGGAATGAGLAVLGLAGPALGRPAGVVRPPGSLPEDDFLARCVRCGLCAAACPTNTLQPAWFAAGGLGLFSPVVTPAVGFCNPACHACAPACPTAAILPLGEERTFAKIGTAEVVRKKCLAWEDKKKCLVCDEVCPYDAVDLKPEPGNPVAVPHVDEKRCAGCGFCERYCPVPGEKAIVVRPKDAIRLRRGSAAQAAQARGLRLEFKPKEPGALVFDEDYEGLPPGFSE